MIYAQILSQRPFSIADGDRFLIITTIKGNNQVFTRSYKNKPLFTKTFKEAKTFKERKTLDACIKKLFLPNNIEYQIYQVKDLFEPRYLVEYFEKKVLREPKIKCYTDWFLRGEDIPNTYKDYEDALTALTKNKCKLIEHYYQIILQIKYITITEI